MSKIYEALKRAERDREEVRTGPTRAAAQPGDLAYDSDSDAEDYRRLRASIVGTTDLHTVLVASSHHGEGTTRVALGLATALCAEQGTRVLLVEGNLRSPSLSGLLALGPGPGLADFLAGQATAEALVHHVTSEDLSVVHAGERQGIVDCEKIGALLASLGGQFDFTIVDVPPVNHYADASVLAPKVDGVILVVEADQTPVVDAEAAKRSLERTGGRILGVVLNRRRSYIPAVIQAFF
jgi:capsular exopolysaccharide synthesis family protein